MDWDKCWHLYGKGLKGSPFEKAPWRYCWQTDLDKLETLHDMEIKLDPFHSRYRHPVYWIESRED